MITGELARLAATVDLRGRCALVVGDAGGVGGASALILALAGAQVVACRGAGEPDADGLATELGKVDGDHLVMAGDIGGAEQVAELVEACRTHLGRLDIIVNVAGPVGSPSAATVDDDEFRRVVDATLTTTYTLIRHSLGLLSAGSAVVNVGGLAGAEDAADGAHYAAAAAGLVGLTRSLARELGPSGVRVNLVSGADPVAIGVVAAFLASTQSAGITGQTVVLDGDCFAGPRLVGAHALVTGGTRGVGRATSLALARAGTSVLACYRSDDVAAATLCAEPDWDPARCHVVRADLSTDDGRHAVIAAAVAHFGGLDVLVNNFGSYHPAPLHAIAPRDLAESLFTNLTAHLLLTQAALPVLRDGGAVVTIGAGMAERGRPGHTHFTAAKAGLVGFTLSLAKELAPRRIRVNTVAPGVVETERGIDLPPAVRDAILSAIPLRRFVTSADVANTVVFLAGELAGALDGATVNVDGGI